MPTALPPLSLPAPQRRVDALVLCSVVAVGLVCSSLAFVGVRETQALHWHSTQAARAGLVQDQLERDIARTVDTVHHLGLVVESQPRLRPAQFDRVRRRLEADNPSLSELQWKPRPLKESAEEQQAHGSGRPVASAIRALTGSARAAMTVVAPVYVLHTDMRVQLRGFVQATISLPALLDPAGQRAQPLGLDLQVYDLGNDASAPHTLLYAYPATASTLGEADAQAISVPLKVAQRNWLAVLHVRGEKAPGKAPDHAVLAALAGGLLTLLVVTMVWGSQRYRRRLDAARRQAQRTQDILAREQRRLQTIIDGTGVATWEFDFRTRKLLVGERWAQLMGYTLEAMGPDPYLTWLTLVHPGELPNMQTQLHAHLDTGREYSTYEYRVRHQQGHWMWVATRVRVLEYNALEQPIRIGGTNVDISAQKDAEARIRQLNASLEQRIHEEGTRSEARATLGTLIASVSHEMATPMGNCLMTASTLEDQARRFQALLDAGELRRSALAEFIAQVRTGNALLMRNLERSVALLKNFRQVAADQASEQRRTFDLRTVVHEVLHTITPSLKRVAHTVVAEVPEGIALDSYPGPLGQVLINLINNAYLHAFEGMPQGTVTLHAHASDQEVTLVCEDNGQGMAPEVLEKIFTPFFSTRIGDGGTGLGLAIVDALVKSPLGGRLDVQSTPRAGTRVTLTLPRVAPAPQRDTET